MLAARGIRVRFGELVAVDDATLEVPEGQTLAVLGPSGCGKSTLLRAIAGLQPAERGQVEVGGRDLTDVPAHRRGVGLMFQDGALFPHRDVAGNVAFGLRMAHVGARERERRVAAALTLVGLSGYERRRVDSLSGGEEQRVALARALAPEPRVLLLDEPLGSLDRPLHDHLLEELAELFTRLAITVVTVTHDVTDAFALGHRIAVMRAGRVVQVATPDALWAAPADAWIARFLGHANVTEENGRALVTRPEAVRFVPARDGEAVVVSVERRGPLVRLGALLPEGRRLEAVTTVLDHPLPGDRVHVEIDPTGTVEVAAG